MTRGIFQFHCYCVLTHRDEQLRAMVDPNLVGLFRRIIEEHHDCYLCRRTLDLDPTSAASPGIIGYVHSDRPQLVGMAACKVCVMKLGNERTARKIGQMFVMSCLAAVEKGNLGRMRMGAIDVVGNARVHWHGERDHSRIRWITVDKDGNEVRR